MELRKTVVVYPMDAFGHIHPMMFIAKEMHDRGHRVVVMSTREASWAPKLRKMGLTVVHCVDEPIDQGEADFTKTVKSDIDADPMETFKKITGPGGFVALHMKDLHSKHDLIQAKLASLKPDLILVDTLLSLPCVVKMGCPYATLFPACPSGIFSYFNDNCACLMGLALDEMTPEMSRFADDCWQPLLDTAAEFYEKNGIKMTEDKTRYRKLGLSSAVLNFYLGPREISYEITGRFKPPSDTWFRLEHTIKRAAGDDNVFEVPQCLRDLPGKLIYISLGTVASGDPSIINRLLPMLGKSPNRFIVSMGPYAEQVKLLPNMWGEAFLDQKAVLQVVDMFITHGGHNSTIEAFYYGVPSLVVLPAFGDQLDIAQRVEECGFGRRLNPFTCTEDELLAAIEAQLANEETKRRMKEIGERLRSIDYPSIAADKLEELMQRNS